MADLKITSLPALAEAGIQATDVLALADISATETKKVTVKDIVAAAAQFLDAGDIPAAKVGTLGTDQVATGAIVDGAVTNVKLANSSISLGGVSISLGGNDGTPAFLLTDATGYLTSNLIGTITNAQLAGSIAGTKLLDTTVTYAKLNISDGDIPGAKIATGGITATQLAANSVTASELADDAVDTAAIADGAVVAASIATDTITANQIAANAIGASELADNSVDAGAIASNAVTTIKILDANVTAAKLAANLPGSILATGAISSTQLAADSVTASELANNAVDSGAIAASAVTDAKIASGIDGAKITDGTITASKLATANIDRSLNVASGNLGINNVVTGGASTRSGITYNAQGLITSTEALSSSDLPLATTSAVGAISVSTGLAITGAGALSLSNSVTAATGATKVNYDASGQITGSSSLLGSDLPSATTGAKGAVQITSGGGLTVDGSGNLTTSTSGVSAGEYLKVTVNTKGVVTSASTTLAADDIPDISATKLTSGTLNAGRFATNSIPGSKFADSSVCKFTGAASTSGIVTFPTAEYKGQFFYDLTNDDLYVYDGSAFQPVTITSGEIIYAGNYRADTNVITSLSAAGTAQGYSVGAALQAASEANNRYYFVCDKSGTGTSPAPTVTINPPDMILSNGSSYEKLDISNFIAGQQASNISVTAAGGIQNTNVQSALEELDTEKLNLTGGTLTGNLALNQSSSLIFEGATPDDFETTLTVIDPTADRTLSLPNVTGTLVSTGDTGSVTSTMITDGTIVNADINASAAIALTKLANVTAAQIIVGNASNVPTAVAVTGDISISNAGLVSITADSIVNADIKSDAAISGSKIVPGTTSVVGVVQLVDSVSSASTALAATGASVKTVNDSLTTTTATANAALPKAGGTLTGNLIVDNAKQIRFTEADANGANYVSLQAPDSLVGDVSYTLPSAAPTANGQVLASTTGGVLSWTEDPTGGWVTSGNDISYSAGDVSFIGTSNKDMVWDKSDSALEFADNAKAVFGTGSDLQIYHDGSTNIIDAATSNAISFRRGGSEQFFIGNAEFKGGDNKSIKLGTGDDLTLRHNGTDTYVDNITGNFYIRGGSNSIHIRPKNDENSIVAASNGSVELYYDNSKKLETVSQGILVTGAYYGSDWVKIQHDNKGFTSGANDDLQIYHSGAESWIRDTGTGNLFISTSGTHFVNAANSENHLKIIDNGACQLYYDGVKKFETIAGGVKATGYLTCDGIYMNSDNDKAFFGASQDLQIYHDGTNTTIHNATGTTVFRADELHFNNAANTENKIKAVNNGQVELYYDNSKKFETTSGGAKVTGTLEVTEDFVTTMASGYDFWIDRSASKVQCGDNVFFRCGNSGDLQIYHDGTHNYIASTNGGDNLIRANYNKLQTPTGENCIETKLNGAVDLFYDNSKKLETSSTGVDVSGQLKISVGGTLKMFSLGSGNGFNFQDNIKAEFGNAGDLKIYHNGTDSFIHNATGDLVIKSDSFKVRNGAESEKLLDATNNGAVSLYYDNSKKLETTSSGVTVTGSVTETSDVSLKNDINTIQNPLELIEQIRGINFTWKNNGMKSMGVIAQDVEKVFPELVHGQEGSKTLQYSGLIGALVESVKELSAKVAALEAG